jgi:hypothetical protein
MNLVDHERRPTDEKMPMAEKIIPATVAAIAGYVSRRAAKA